jgi:hypothetical protein
LIRQFPFQVPFLFSIRHVTYSGNHGKARPEQDVVNGENSAIIKHNAGVTNKGGE